MVLMRAGYSLRHLHESRVDQRLESIEKAVRKSTFWLLIVPYVPWLELLYVIIGDELF